MDCKQKDFSSKRPRLSSSQTLGLSQRIIPSLLQVFCLEVTQNTAQAAEDGRALDDPIYDLADLRAQPCARGALGSAGSTAHSTCWK